MKIEREYVFRTIAVNEVGSSPPSPISTVIKILPKKKDEPPIVQEGLQNITSETNKKIILSCVFGGFPIPQVTWYKNDTIITSKSIITYENRIAKLIIENTTIEDEATYTCIAENTLGKVQTSCEIKIQDKPTLHIDNKYLSQKLRVGSTFEVKASYKGYPKPNIKWYKETKEITETIEKYTIKTEETTTSIIIKDLLREDSGKYKVEAQNSAGSSAIEVTLKTLGTLLKIIFLIYKIFQ